MQCKLGVGDKFVQETKCLVVNTIIHYSPICIDLCLSVCLYSLPTDIQNDGIPMILGGGDVLMVRPAHVFFPQLSCDHCLTCLMS